MSRYTKYALRALLTGVICAVCFVGAQVATYSVKAQVPTTSPGGTLNFISDGLMFAFNVDSNGTRNWFPMSPSVTLPTAASTWTLISSGSATKTDLGNSVVPANLE